MRLCTHGGDQMGGGQGGGGAWVLPVAWAALSTDPWKHADGGERAEGMQQRLVEVQTGLY